MTAQRAFADASITVGSAPPLDPDLVEAAGRLGAATLHEAGGRIGALPSDIKPVSPDFRMAGPAFTISGPPCDNLWLHRALAVAPPGAILVAHVSNFYEAGYWGEVMSTAALAAGIGGLIIDGGVRDATLIASLGFPVFARRICIRGTGKDFGALGSLNEPILIGDVIVQPGDLVVGDCDGVVVIPNRRAAEIVDASIDREAQEGAIMARLKEGETTLDLFGLNR